MIKICEKCKNEFHSPILIKRKLRNLQHRKFCFSCSPFGHHNTQDITGRTKSERKARRAKQKLSLIIICSKCKKNKPRSEYFNSQLKRRDIRSLMCKQCSNDYFAQKGIDMKKRAIAYKGGKCEDCGLSWHYAVYHFHHLDPKLKDKNMGGMRTCGWIRIKKEIDKCVLLCSNCHVLRHVKIWDENRKNKAIQKVIS